MSCRPSAETAVAHKTPDRPADVISPPEPALDLPTAFGAWTRSAPPRRIEPSGIFDYMDGGGELYLAYRFRSLDVYLYSAASLGTIQVEIYTMETSDDAFGLLSGDWSGEPVVMGEPAAASTAAPIVPPQRALYGAGLCRLWADRVYARVLASTETSASREQVLSIGRAIALGRLAPPPPAIVAVLPPTASEGFSLSPESIVFLRSHLVLNAAYYLAPRDLLGLGPTAEAVHAEYLRPRRAGPPARVHLVMVRYGDAMAALRGFEGFRAAYLTEHAVPNQDSSDPAGAFAIEDGWLGFRLQGRVLALVFEAPGRALATALAEDAVRRLTL